MPSKVARNILGQMGEKDCCNRRLEAVPYLKLFAFIWSGKFNLYRGKVREFWKLMTVATMKNPQGIMRGAEVYRRQKNTCTCRGWEVIFPGLVGNTRLSNMSRAVL